MKVLITITQSTKIPMLVLKCIGEQGPGYEIDVVDCTFDKFFSKRARIVMAKEKCKTHALADPGDFFIYHDRDILQLRPDNFSSMKKFLELYPDFGAVALCRDNVLPVGMVYEPSLNNHICSGVMMLRRTALEKVNFGNDPSRPTCFAVGKSLSDNGFKYGYVDDLPRIRHLKLSD
jgi:hypothetical protein